MIAVDTSVWVEFFRGRNGSLCRHLEALLDSNQAVVPVPVRVEILGGCRKAELPKLRRVMAALPLLSPTISTWTLIERWLDRAIAAGQHFGVADLLIGAIAVESGAPIWSLDSDFGRLARLGLVEIHQWPE
jgi:predicted nucleic acid-binding protein